MRPLFRTLDLYIHRTCRDLGWIIVLCYIRAIISVLSLMGAVLAGGGSHNSSNMVFSAILNILVLFVCHARKSWGTKAIRILFGIPFGLNVVFLMESVITSDSYLIGYNAGYVLMSGLMFLFTLKSVRLSYFFLCTKDRYCEEGIPYSFGNKSYLPKYNVLILYHAIESEALSLIKFKGHDNIVHRKSKMNQSVDIFNAYLAVACTIMQKTDIIEEVIFLREKLMKVCRWNKSLINANEDSFMSCTYVLRKTYRKTQSIETAISELVISLCMPGLNVDSEELYGGLLMFYEAVKSPEFYENYYNNSLMQKASLYIN